MSYELENSCRYSFDDLIKAAGHKTNIETICKMPQKRKNVKVKFLCKKAGWYYKDVVGNDGVTIYTQFAPNIKN